MAVGILNPRNAPSDAATESARTEKLGDTNRHFGSNRKRIKRASHYKENEKNNVTITLLKAKTRTPWHLPSPPSLPLPDYSPRRSKDYEG